MVRKNDMGLTMREISIVREGLRCENTGTELCHREGIHPNMYHKPRCGDGMAEGIFGSGLLGD